MQTITLEEAQARLLEVVHCVMSEKVELLRSIDRILAEDVYAHVRYMDSEQQQSGLSESH